MEHIAMRAEKQGLRLQQVRVCSNTTVMGTEIKGRGCLPSVSCLPSDSQRSPIKYLYLHCQPLMKSRKGWILSPPFPITLHAPELLWVGPAFPSDAQSLFQAVT